MTKQNGVKVARVYLRVSTEEQDLKRQENIVEEAKTAGYYVAAVYREKASGATANRPELARMIDDLQSGEVVIAEKIDRISRLPLEQAEQLVAAIKSKGARLAVPDVIDLSELAGSAQGVAKVVIDSIQEMLLRVALQISRDDYESRRERQRQGIVVAKADGRFRGRKPDLNNHARIVALRGAGHSIKQTAKIAGCSEAQVKRVMSLHRAKD